MKGGISTRYAQDWFVRLNRIYALYDELCAEVQACCRKGCALCCTSNVTLTSLEAALIMTHWQRRNERPPFDELQAAARKPLFRPTITINHLAERCAQGLEGPDEAADPAAGACTLLAGTVCSIYTVRPFACRCMQSLHDCRAKGAAEMPEWLVSANTLFLQFIEALDSSGVSGNLAELLPAMGSAQPPPPSLPANRGIPLLMIPPQHRRRLLPAAVRLRQILAGV